MVEKLYPYNRFIGLDSMADRRQMGERFLEICEHAFVDSRGQINKLYGHKLKGGLSAETTMYVEHYGMVNTLYGAKNGANIDLKATGGTTQASGWTWGANLDWVKYLTKEHALNDGQAPWSWDGTAWLSETVAFPSAIRGGCATTLMGRLCVSGYSPTYTEIAVSKAGSLDFTVAGTGADDAARIDISDDLTGRDIVRGLGTFEGNKLAIFCQNETLLFVADEDINQWSLLRDFRVPVGTIGKRTIKRVGNDLFFASRAGVHSIRRSINGVTLESIMFSRTVQDIYERLMERMHATWEPRAVWNPKKGHYHLMIPQIGDYWSRLTFTIEQAGRTPHLSWGFTPSAGWADGAYFDGLLCLAVPTVGLCDADFNHTTDTSRMRVRTAVLYQGAPQRRKNYKRLLVRLSGDAPVTIRAYDADRELIDDDVYSSFPGSGVLFTPERPLDLPFEHYGYGVQIEFESEALGDLRIMDFALLAE